MCLIQHNYMDTEKQAGTEGLHYAAEKGLAVAIMEPLLGGSLARPPEAVEEIFRAYDSSRSPARWALGWLWDQPEVSVVLSGMSDMVQVEANLDAADVAAVGMFTAEEQAVIDRAREAFRERAPLPCTKCGCCMPCENGVNIPSNFEIYNDAVMYADSYLPSIRYRMVLRPEEKAAACTGCAECEEKCPQGIVISECMPKVEELLGG